MRLQTVRDDVVRLIEGRTADARGNDADVEKRESHRRPLGSRTLPHYVPARTVHITYSACSPQEEAWIQHAGQTWRAFGYTLAQIVAHAWATDESTVRPEVTGLDERTRYNFTIVLPHTDSPELVPELLREAIQRDFAVDVSPGGEPPTLVVKAR